MRAVKLIMVGGGKNSTHTVFLRVATKVRYSTRTAVPLALTINMPPPLPIWMLS
jgi:hypothetical protein